MNKYISVIESASLYKYFHGTDSDSDNDFSQWGGVINRIAVAEVLPKLKPYLPLFKFQEVFYNTQYNHLTAQSPLFFEVPTGESTFLEYLETITSSWGFLWAGEVSSKIARIHWQSLLTVILPTQELTHFRYYSSSVLSKFIMSCKEEEIVLFLGPFSHIFIPLLNSQISNKSNHAKWLCIINPRYGVESPKKIADTYQVFSKPWWLVTEEHIQAFADTLEKVYRDNLEQRLWELYPEQTKEIDVQYGSVGDFVAASLQDARSCGLLTREQEYRFLLLGVHYNFSSANCPHLKSILEQVSINPEAALVRLEQALRNSSYE